MRPSKMRIYDENGLTFKNDRVLGEVREGSGGCPDPLFAVCPWPSRDLGGRRWSLIRSQLMPRVSTITNDEGHAIDLPPTGGVLRTIGVDVAHFVGALGRLHVCRRTPSRLIRMSACTRRCP